MDRLRRHSYLPRSHIRARSNIFRSLFTGAISLALDTAVFWLLVQTGLPSTGSAAAAFSCGILSNYALHHYWQWSEYRPSVNGLIRFCAVGLAGLGLTTLGVWMGTEWLGLAPMTAKAVVVGPVFIFNFVCREIVVLDGNPAPCAPRHDVSSNDPES